ncbi:serine hydrolase domain-containing protein [Bacillus marinisedimentorum]|uniref:serine hydrolase domain-containing protein n=1 Tax=Bacillus marinisedimentorum TaxID=1821260 RepID=UPI0007E1027C|nr:serine hydrolase [Bacillus marinisedimentorum]
MKKFYRISFFIAVLLLISFTIISCSTNDKEETDSLYNEGPSSNANGREGTAEHEAIPQETVKIEPYWPTEEWRKASPESAGMDSSYLVDMFRYIEGEHIPMEGFLIVKDGYIVAEKYGGAYSEGAPHPIYSVTKSLASAAVGAAIKEGEINSVDEKALHYLEAEKVTDLNDWKNKLTIKHLLTMKSGLDFPEQSQKGFYESDTWKNFMDSEDPAYYIMNRPVRSDRDSWSYSTGDARVVSKIIQEATGSPLSDYMQERVFDPLGIKGVEWPSDRSGTSFGGIGVKMKPRDMARFGYLYLKGGKWEDEQILPEGWVEESTQPYGDTNGNFDGSKYGYYFWLKSVKGYDTYRAMGLYGQYIVVVPELDLVVVQTSSGMDVDPLLEEYIIPSMK